jgi:non-specific serine/threonine protein kinase
MGLGKTVQAIAFLSGIADGTISSRASIKTPHLIVVPTTLVFNWVQELKKFSPKLKVKEYISKLQTIDLEKFDIIITTYDRIRIDIEKLKNITFHVLILDEAQAIKNIGAGRSAAVRQLKSLFTISLTGTPLENHIGEYYSIIDVALPGLLPEYKDFMKQIQSDDQGNLIRRTKPFVLRRTKDAILQELPPKIENNVYLHMAEKQQKLYATTVREVKRLIDRAYESHTAGQANIIALTAILRLRQICISPQIIDPKAGLDSPKIEYLITALSEVIQENNAALVFSQFTKCLDIVEQQLKKEGIKFFRIDGSTPIPQRKKIIETFQDKDVDVSVLLLSLKTGGVGLNLTRASYVYHIDPWWNPAVENQASDRAHRIGQKKSVFIARIVMHHTIEEKMMQLKEAKSKLFNDVMNATENKTKTIISKKDFDFLLE